MQVAVAEQKAQTQVRRTPPSDPATPEESGGSVTWLADVDAVIFD